MSASDEQRETGSSEPSQSPSASTPPVDGVKAGTKTQGSTGDSAEVVFAHASEQEFARILDFYHVEWRYEPTTFPIEWDEEGRTIAAFTPDFYLPEQDLYIEITTLRQSLVTKKNRKVRRLRELYPDVNIRVLYASDFRKLIEKFVASGRLNARLGAQRGRTGSDWGSGAQK